MLKRFAKLILTANAAKDILKEKAELKAAELFIQLRNFTKKDSGTASTKDNLNSPLKENVRAYSRKPLHELISEIHHKAQINELQLKSFIKDKLTELTNNALLDSIELNDIRGEIATLRAELKDLKEELQLQKSKR